MTEAVTDQSVAEFLAEQWDPQLTCANGGHVWGLVGWRSPHGPDGGTAGTATAGARGLLQAFAAAGAIGAPTGLGTLMGWTGGAA